jgi:hypothetical protein
MRKLNILFGIVFLFLLVGTVNAESSFIFKKSTPFNLELSMGNTDLSSCATCTCEVSIFYPNGTALIRDAVGTNVGGFCQYSTQSDILGVHGVEMVFTDGADSGRANYNLDITESGESFGISQAIILIVEFGIVALFFGLGWSFKDKWKVRSFFFMFALLMGTILLNSVRIITGTGSSMAQMGNMGLILGIVVLLFMFLYLLIFYFVDVFKQFKTKKENKWNP